MKQSRITISGEHNSIRAEVDEGGKKYFVGYAAVYNSRSRLILERGREFVEILEPGCFDRVLENNKLDVILNVNHQKLHNLGRTISGNLTLTSDNIGLKFRALVPNTTLGNDTYEMIQRGDYTDCSFSFDLEEAGEKWERENNGLLHRVGEVSALYDVCICTLHGAYAETIVDVERANRMLGEIEAEQVKKDTEAAAKNAEMLERQRQYRKNLIISQ